MSTGDLKSIDKLRELATGSHSYISNGRVLEFVNEIEQEIAERYIELPVDGDGVPIRVGDTVEYLNGKRDVVRFITVNDNEPTFNEMGWIASKCRHVNQRTIEDAIADALRDYAITDMSRDEVIAKYAEEIRGMMA